VVKAGPRIVVHRVRDAARRGGTGSDLWPETHDSYPGENTFKLQQPRAGDVIGAPSVTMHLDSLVELPTDVEELWPADSWSGKAAVGGKLRGILYLIARRQANASTT
jgi:hypothetical protein